MRRQLKRVLGVLVVAGAFVFAAAVLLSPGHEQAFLVDGGETRPAVEAALRQLQALEPASIEDPEFRRAVGQLLQVPHVATVWLYAPDGQFVEATGSTAAFGGSNPAEKFASLDVRGVLDTVPEEELRQEQRTMLLVASAIRAEWTHNDVYRHTVCPIRDPEGSPVAIVGAGYTVTSGAHNRMDGVGFLLGGLPVILGFLCYWLGLPLWVLLDARQRGDRAVLWAVFVLLGNLVAVVAYLLCQLPRTEGARAR